MRNTPNPFHPSGRDFSSKPHFTVHIRNMIRYEGDSQELFGGSKRILLLVGKHHFSAFLILLQKYPEEQILFPPHGRLESKRKQAMLASLSVLCGSGLTLLVKLVLNTALLLMVISISSFIFHSPSWQK